MSSNSEDRSYHMDIADLLIRQHRKEHITIVPVEERRDPMKHPSFLKLNEMGNVANEEEVAKWIEEFDLQIVGCKNII